MSRVRKNAVYEIRGSAQQFGQIWLRGIRYMADSIAEKKQYLR